MIPKGCGIGVLLRMVWVMTVVILRAIRGGNRDEEDYDSVVFAAEEVDAAPPAYSDEKRAEGAFTDSSKTTSTRVL